jgi:ubiquinone/menaquinone biosynthesis C-methylase UbiE
MRTVILPSTIGAVNLGDDVLEVGPGYGAATDVVSESVPRLTAVEIDELLVTYLIDRFAAQSSVHIIHGDATALEFDDGRFSSAICFTMLHHVPSNEMQDRLFAEVRRVLRPGAAFVASDNLASEDLAAHHDGDTYNPIDPATLAGRLDTAGFVDIVVTTNPFAWQVVAYAPS